MSSLERLFAEARSRSNSYIAAAKAGAESRGEGALLAQIASIGGGISPLSRQSQMYHHVEQYRHFIGTVYTAIRPIAQRICCQPVRVAKRASKSKKTGRKPTKAVLPEHLKNYAEELEVLETHSLLDAIKRPNPVTLQWQLMYQIVASIMITGKEYLWDYDEKDKKTKKVAKQLWHTPASWIQDRHTATQLFAWYDLRIENSTETTKVPPEQITRIVLPDPANPIGSTSPLQTQARHVTSDEAIAEAQRRSFSNGAFPGLAVITGKHPDISGTAQNRAVLTREQREQILNAFRQRYRGVQHVDEPVILDGVIEDIKPITNRPRDMDFLNSMELMKRRLEQSWGVNPIINGELQDANRASATAASDLFDTYTINPNIALLSQAFTTWLLPKFDEDPDMVAYIEEHHSTDPDERRADFQFMYDRAMLSINEVRQEYGKPPVHWGDVAYVPTTLQPVHVVREDRPEPKDEDLPGAEQRELERQDKLDALRQRQDQQQQQPTNGKPQANGKPSANGNSKPEPDEKPDKQAMVRLAKEFLRLRGVGQHPAAPAAAPVSNTTVNLPAAPTPAPAPGPVNHSVKIKISRNPKTQLFETIEREVSYTPQQ